MKWRIVCYVFVSSTLRYRIQGVIQGFFFTFVSGLAHCWRTVFSIVGLPFLGQVPEPFKSVVFGSLTSISDVVHISEAIIFALRWPLGWKKNYWFRLCVRHIDSLLPSLICFDSVQFDYVINGFSRCNQRQMPLFQALLGEWRTLKNGQLLMLHDAPSFHPSQKWISKSCCQQVGHRSILHNIIWINMITTHDLTSRPHHGWWFVREIIPKWPN